MRGSLIEVDQGGGVSEGVTYRGLSGGGERGSLIEVDQWGGHIL